MHPTRWLLLATGLAAVIAAGWLVGGRASRSGTPAAPPGSSAGGDTGRFVGRGACVSCHADEAALWSGSHHDLAMQEAAEATVLGDFDATTFDYAGVTTTFFRRGDAYMVRTDGPDGELTDYEVAYTFGVDPLQQYLVEFPDGRIQVLGIAWDTRPAEVGGQRWFHLYPDEAITHDDVLHWTGPAQTWNFMCAECHSTDLQRGYSVDTDRYETTWSEIDVSCEACHGPGERHVEWAEAGARTDGLDARPRSGGLADETLMGLHVDLGDPDEAAWIVDADTGLATRTVPRSSHAQLETCARCHSRRSVAWNRYVHGRPLLDTHRPALLTEGLYHADGQIQDEVYVYGSFVQSKMFQAGVTCSDCHDAHALTVRGEGNARCAACHLPARFDTPAHHFHEAGSRGASCVACHMPATTYMQVDPRRDHSFRVPRPDLTVALGTPNACTSCHDDRAPEWAADAVDRWYGPDREPHFGTVLAAARRREADAGQDLAALAHDPDLPTIVRATAVSELVGYPGLETRRAIETTIAADDPLLRLAGVTAAERLPPEVRAPLVTPVLDDAVRLVRTEAARVLASAPDSLLDDPGRRALDRGLAEYRRSQLANADRAESHVNLGVLHVQRNEPEAAEAAYRRAMSLNPAFVPAYANLADLYRSQQRDADVERTLEEGLRRVPDSGDLHHALGLLRVRQERRAEAVTSLRRAAELLPEVPRYAYVYGVALHSTGRPAEALAVLEEAHERHPTDVEILIALATMNRDAGEPARALEFARRLERLRPDDPQVDQLVEQLVALTREAGGNGSGGHDER